MAETVGTAIYEGLMYLGVEEATASVAAYYAASAVVYVAQVAAVTAASNALIKKPTGLGRGLEITINDPSSPARMILGEVRCAGVNVIPPFSYGNSGDYLALQQVFAAHECEDCTDVYFDQDKIPDANIGAITGTDADGVITGAAGVNFNDFAWVRRKLGTLTQTTDYKQTQAFPAAFGADHRGRGLAQLYLTLRTHTNKGIFLQGVPNITAVWKGLKCYDPRLDSTNGGSGSQRYTDSTTWTYTSTPALQIATFLLTNLCGEAWDPTEIDWSTVAAAATICEASLSGGNAPPSGAQPRYTCNGALWLQPESFVPNLQAMTDAMMGKLTNRDGIWRMYAGAWDSPVHSIDYSDFISPVTVRASDTREERWNGVRCFFVDKDKNWQRRECYARINDTYRTADGGERLWAEVEQSLCNNEYEAQRKAEFFLRQSRNQIKVTGVLPPKFQRIAIWETVTLSWPVMGWASKTFRVIEAQINVDGSIEVVLKEEQQADWTDLAAAEYNTASTVSLPTVNPTVPDAPSNFALTQGVNGTLRFVWDHSTIRPLGGDYTIIRSTNSGDASVGTVAWRGNTNYADVICPTSPHWYYIRATAPGSNFSAYVPNTFGQYGFALSEADNTARAQIVGDRYFDQYAGSSLWFTPQLNGTFSYSPTGGQHVGYGIITCDSHANVGSTYLLAAMNARVNCYPAETYGGGYNPGAGEKYMKSPGGAGAYEFSLRAAVRSHSNVGSLTAQFGLSVGATWPKYGALFMNGLVANIPNSSWPAVNSYVVMTGRRVFLGPAGDGALKTNRMRAEVLVYPGARMELDAFNVRELGYLNEVIEVSTLTECNCSNQFQLYDYHSMVRATLTNTTNEGTVRVSSLQWENRIPMNARLRFAKVSSGNAMFIVPNSGQNLLADGFTAVGTVRIPETVVGEFSVTRIGQYDWRVSGPGIEGVAAIPQKTASSAYTLGPGDNNNHVFISTGGVVIPTNASVALPVGFACTIVNNSASSQTITTTGVTCRLSGTATTGDRTIPLRGLCTLLKVATDEWHCFGPGVT